MTDFANAAFVNFRLLDAGADAIAAGDPVRSRHEMLQLVHKGREDILSRIETSEP